MAGVWCERQQRKSNSCEQSSSLAKAMPTEDIIAVD